METHDIQEVYTYDKFNKEVLDIKNNRCIVKLVLNDGRPTKYMLIRNELALRDSKRNIPRYGLQGEDIGYHYNYGKFHTEFSNKLTREESNYYYSNFHSSGHVVFGDKISSWTIYKSREDIKNINNEIDKNIMLKLHSDIRQFNWLPNEDLGY
jgi:hypothetical protein